MTIFDVFLANTLAVEGGLSIDPADPGNWTGGRVNSGQCLGTWHGISSAAYPGILAELNHPPGFPPCVQKLSFDQIATIYRTCYYDKVRGDDLPPGLALVVADCAVNSGPSRAVEILQAALGVQADGVLGPITLSAASHAYAHGPEIALARYQAEHLAWLETLGSPDIAGLRVRVLSILARAGAHLT